MSSIQNEKVVYANIFLKSHRDSMILTLNKKSPHSKSCALYGLCYNIFPAEDIGPFMLTAI